ncbi:Sec63 Brl domain-containing protein [Lipomyces japonicus]|uniref:Sec63 Brl domain-containing protein n=1 Tax=Lipomyces japonicus TaxID=56871 RepID=UPI0034CD17E2
MSPPVAQVGGSSFTAQANARNQFIRIYNAMRDSKSLYESEDGLNLQKIDDMEQVIDTDWDNYDLDDFLSDSEDSSESDNGSEFSSIDTGNEITTQENGEGFGHEWLIAKCQSFLIRNNSLSLSADELASTLEEILKSRSADNEIESRLLDILGFDDIEFAIELIRNRSHMLESSAAPINHHSQVWIKNNSEPKVYMKKGIHDDLDTKYKTPRLLTKEEHQKKLEANIQARKMEPPPAASSSEMNYPHVYRAHNAGNTLSAYGNKYSLPVGTTRESLDLYEEIIVPYPKSKPVQFGEKLVNIRDMDLICKETFKGYKTLNRVQSLVYPVAYGTNSNMLICAPTGAGKTDVAMLTILNAISMNCTPSPFRDPDAEFYHVAKNDFKIVYVAPLKALAAEVVEKLGKRLKWLGIEVRELTGDMQLTRNEIMKTQIIVTTPEKWDVVTRKSSGDSELVDKVKLLIIDEVHMLHDERGAVIESLVSRTLRQVETTQSMIRLIGLSATLPNFIDVADFLKVDRHHGLFFFDASFRPVPLEQHFIGVRGKSGSKLANENLDKVTYQKVVEMLKQDHQIMVFVHSRKDTLKTVKALKELAMVEGDFDLFDPSFHTQYKAAQIDMARSKNKDIREIFRDGFGVHHAGMLRSDRNLTERLFSEGVIKVLCCTATLAWGVNLPAAAVIIKGTQVYDPKKGGFTDLGITDVIQIFGRAGRPQFEKFGISFLCTSVDRLDHYLSTVTQQQPIESTFVDRLVDNLNAEIALGTVTNVDEGVQWLGYTYLYVRMRRNPMKYGIDWKQVEDDNLLGSRRRELIIQSARILHKTQMIIFDERTGSLTAKDVGRIASDFYLLYNSIEIFNTMMKPSASEADVLAMLSMSGEFDGLKSRDEESKELTSLRENYAPCQVAGTTDTSHGKINILLQSYISRANIDAFSLVSDTAYVAQNAARISRALFLIAMNRRWGRLANVILTICKAIDKRLWPFESELAQFDLPKNALQKLEAKSSTSIEDLRELGSQELGELVGVHRLGNTIFQCLWNFPLLAIEFEVSPILRSILRVHLVITANFEWHDRVNGSAESFWIWVEDSDDSTILHSSKFILSKKHLNDPHEMDFFIPLSDPLPGQIVVRAVSNTWAGAETVTPISFQHLIRPENENIQTKLLNLRPLPISALENPVIEEIYRQKFNYFNPMQTMIFHCLYHSATNVLLGSPTGSGKTVAAELSMWWAFREYPKCKVVYIAPMKALVRERVDDWTARLGIADKRVVELTGDSAPDAKSIRESDIIITTPEKFDGISRNWKSRKYVQEIRLIIMDEIHLLAGERGPILEMIVSRMNYIASQTSYPVRIVGMSTAIANAGDMAGWLGVEEGLFNFPQSIRPVPLDMYIDGFQDNTGFCPLMKSMNKPAFMAIKSHSPSKPSLIFVASRRQTRLTSSDLINFCGLEENPKRFLKMQEYELAMVLSRIKDEALKLSLQFGIGQHHAGLVDSDRRIVQELFANNKIQILIATSTLAWGVNLPAHLVIVKGTQFFDGKIEAYKDMDLTDILQMMGRAGRPGFDNSGVAMIFTQESKKQFYKRFVHSGFPVESSLHKVLDDNLGAEISGGTITTSQEALDFMACTYLFRRIHKNPSYYSLEENTPEAINDFLVHLVDQALHELEISKCIKFLTDGTLESTAYLRIGSYYYISHKTVRNILLKIKHDITFEECLQILAEASEYDLLPVRHNEDLLNIELSKQLRFKAEHLGKIMWDPHVKAFLLLQAHLSRIDLPVTDYLQDMISVLDQSLRVLQACIDISAEIGFASATKQFIVLTQCIKQAIWFDDNPLTALPGLIPVPRNNVKAISSFEKAVKLPRVEKKRLATKLGVPDGTVEEFVKVLDGITANTLAVEYDTDSGEMSIKLTRKKAPLKSDYRVYCPKFPKPQYEGWILLLVNPKNDEIFALKRFRPRQEIPWNQPLAASISIPRHAKGKEVWPLCISDTYLDLVMSGKEFIA